MEKKRFNKQFLLIISVFLLCLPLKSLRANPPVANTGIYNQLFKNALIPPAQNRDYRLNRGVYNGNTPEDIDGKAVKSIVSQDCGNYEKYLNEDKSIMDAKNALYKNSCALYGQWKTLWINGNCNFRQFSKFSGY